MSWTARLRLVAATLALAGTGAAFAADLSLVTRYATWEAQRWPGDGSYGLTVHRPR